MHQLIDGTRMKMDRRIDAHVARTQFGQIMDRAVEKNERFVVERRGQPAVVIMSVRDFIRTAAPPPDWLEKAWRGVKRRGLDKLTSADIDAEIAAYRREKKSGHRPEAK
jgi:prevent-host-death family protein